jgi:hypothetical protein
MGLVLGSLELVLAEPRITDSSGNYDDNRLVHLVGSNDANKSPTVATITS